VGLKEKPSLRPLKRAGVMGWPVDHSLSPRVHGFWLQNYAIDGEYLRIPVDPEQLSANLRRLKGEGYVGCNITVPHKEAALALVDDVDPLAQRIGAVNTIIIGKDGKLYGTNTDGFGFLENLRQGYPGFDVRAGPAVVLGAGGAARAVVAALLDAGAPEIRLFNRTKSRAENLANSPIAQGSDKIKVGDWQNRATGLSQASLLVNTTTLGMRSQRPLEIDLTHLPVQALVTDIVYTPLITDLLARAMARGNPVVDGLGMLLHQARPGFKAWFGRLPEVTAALRTYVLAESK